MAVALASFLIMILSAAGTTRDGSWWWRVVLVCASAIWPLPDHPLQGPVIIKLSYYHGVHLADLLSVAGFIVAALPWRRLRR